MKIEKLSLAHSAGRRLVDAELGSFLLSQRLVFIRVRLVPTAAANLASNWVLKSPLLRQISRLLDIPLATAAAADSSKLWPEDEAEQLLIGADLIPSLLPLNVSAGGPRVLPLSRNLNAVETRLGCYYLQGTQCNFY